MKNLHKLELLFDIIQDYGELSGLVVTMRVHNGKVILSIGFSWCKPFKSLAEAITFLQGLFDGAYIAEHGAK